jgi:hypothetical protein
MSPVQGIGAHEQIPGWFDITGIIGDLAEPAPDR